MKKNQDFYPKPMERSEEAPENLLLFASYYFLVNAFFCGMLIHDDSRMLVLTPIITFFGIVSFVNYFIKRRSECDHPVFTEEDVQEFRDSMLLLNAVFLTSLSIFIAVTLIVTAFQKTQTILVLLSIVFLYVAIFSSLELYWFLRRKRLWMLQQLPI